MPVKSRGGRRWVEMETRVAATPKDAWRAVATGPGLSAWFVNATVEERVGGRIRFDFGPVGESVGEVTVWRPPFKFSYVEPDWSEDAPRLETDVSVARVGDGDCVIKTSHALETASDEWDDFLGSFEEGWPAFSDVLHLYLENFAGMNAAQFSLAIEVEGAVADVWTELAEALGLVGAKLGETAATAGEPEPLTGVVEDVWEAEGQGSVILRLTTPGPGVAIFEAVGDDVETTVRATMHLYGDDAALRVAAAEPKWRDWLYRILGASVSWTSDYRPQDD